MNVLKQFTKDEIYDLVDAVGNAIQDQKERLRYEQGEDADQVESYINRLRVLQGKVEAQLSTMPQ